MRISEPIIVPLDVRCTAEGCECFRQAVSGAILIGGGFGLKDEECGECSHPSSAHEVVGETKSDFEKRVRK